MITSQRTRRLTKPQPCFICLKTTEPGNNKNNFYYITAICRYLKLTPDSSEDFRHVCENCYPTLDSFSEVYKEWIRLGCKLNQNINQLAKLIQVQHPEDNKGVRGVGHIPSTMTSSSEFRKKLISQVNAVPKVSSSSTVGPNDHEHDEEKETGVSDDDEQPRPGTTQMIGEDKKLTFHELMRKKYKYRCGFCWKRLPNWRSKMQHEKTHQVEKPFKCQFCSLRFIAKNCLHLHELVHTEKMKALKITRKSPPAKTYGRSRKTLQHKMTFGLPPSHEVLVTPKPEPVDFLDESVDDIDNYHDQGQMANSAGVKEDLQQQQLEQRNSVGDDVVGDIKIEEEESTVCYHYVMDFEEQ